MMKNILSILSVILPVLVKYFPSLKPLEEKIKSRLEKNYANIEKFRKTRNTSGLGNFPDKD